MNWCRDVEEGLEVLCPLEGGHSLLWKGAGDQPTGNRSSGAGWYNSFLCDLDEKAGGVRRGILPSWMLVIWP